MKFFPHSPRLSSKKILRSLAGLLALVSLLGNTQLAVKASSPGKDGTVTITTANTIVNTYTSLAADAAAGSASLNVTNTAALGATPGDLILIIQMQGASIDSSVNTSAWGAVTNYNNAGNYEFATVYSVSGNTINLSPCGPFLQRNYTASGRVQIIRVPQYNTLTINAGASISAPPWNGTTGGIAAVVAQNTVTINGSIDVTGTGFRGGVRDNLTTGVVANLPGYAFTTAGGGTTSAAQKGESIAGFTADYDALGGAFPGGYGRGAPANGGGGGNAHNAGGGGGANGYSGIAWNGQGNPDNSLADWTTAWNLDPTLNSATTSSGGGRGGYTYASANNDPRITAPGLAAWGGDRRQERGGLGGRPLINQPAGSNTDNRIFFGGGGGAGDGNNSASADGAAGGGIVFVLAPTVTGTGAINANGRDAGNTIPAHNDAPGGGGGGGSVVVGAATLGGISINAGGGKGGNQLITGNESEGPGGGGGGGVVATSGGVVPISINGGANGRTSSAGVNPEFPPNGATAGAVGNTSTAVPTIPNQSCMGIAKTVSNVTPVAGPAYDVQMVVRVANLGSDQLTNVQVTDNLTTTFGSIPGTTFAVTVPPAVTFASGSGTVSGNNTFNGNTNTNLLNPGTLDIGSTVLITFTVRVTPPAGPGPFTYNNVANGSGTGTVTGGTVNDASQNGTNPDPDGDGNPGNNSAPTPINLTPIIPTVAKGFAPNPVNPATPSTLTITLTNPSGTPLTSATLTDNLPSGLTTVPATAATTCGGTTSQTTTSVSLNNGTIPANGNCTLSVQVVGAAGGAYVNTIPAGALTTSGGANTAPATSTLDVNDASPVTVAKSFNPSSIPVGGVSQLTIIITNPNSIPAVLNNPGLTDNYPAGVINTTPAVVSTTCGGGVTANAGGNFVRLDAGNSVPANGSCNITVNVTSNTAGPAVTNTLGPNSVLTSNPAFGNTNTATATLTVTLLPPTVTKSFGAASVPLSGTTTLTFVVTNPNSTNLTGISFTDVLPTGLTAVNGTTNNVCGGSGTMVITGGNTITITGIAINGAPGGASCTFNVTVTGVSAGVWNNTTGAVSSTQTGIGTTSNTATLAVAPSADLGITKTDGNTTYTQGGTTTYTIVASNAGPFNVIGATVTDTFPASITATWTCVGVGGAVCPANNGNGNINETVNIPVGGSLTYTVTANIDAGATGALLNTATITPPVGTTDPTPGNNSATDTNFSSVCTSGQFALWTFTGDTTTIASGVGTFTNDTVGLNAPTWPTSQIPADSPAISFTGAQNPGYIANSDYVDFAVPTNGLGAITMSFIDYRSATGPDSFVIYYSTDGITYNALPPGTVYAIASAAWTTRSIDFSAVPGLNNNPTAHFRLYPYRVAAGGSPVGTWRLDNVAFGGSCLADLGVTKTNGTANVNEGGTTTYTVVVTNYGPSAANNTVFIDPIVLGLSATNVTCGSETGGAVCPTAGNTTVTLMQGAGIVIPTLPSGGSVTFTVTADVTAASGTVANTANATPPAGITDPGTFPNSATDTDTVSSSADLSLTKTVDNPSPNLGDNVVFTLTLTNAGPSVATNVTVTDSLPVGLTFAAANPSAGTTFANPVWTIPSLAVGSSATLQITATVTQVGSITNTAQVTASDQADPDSTTGNNIPTEDDQASVTLGGIFDPPSAIKTFNDAGLPELEFRMVWINSSNTAAIGVQVTDQIPVGTTYVAGSVTCVPLGVSSNAAVATLPLSAAAMPNSFCGYDPVADRIQWQGIIGPDDGNLTEAAAANEVVITFRVTVNSGVNQVLNQSFSITDVDADSSFIDETVLGTSIVGSNQVIWTRASSNPSTPADDDDLPGILPATGFAPNVVTTLPQQPDEKVYTDTDVWLEIPRLGLKVSIVGVPLVDEKWDLSWLNDQAGWLAGTAFPSWKGNSALTGHVTLSNGKPGPFAELGSLQWNDRIIVHAYGFAYEYQVRESRVIAPNNTSVLKHEENAWLTLITCKGYNESSDSYAKRISVRAVLLNVTQEKTSPTPPRER